MSNSSFLFALQLSRSILLYVIVLVFHPICLAHVKLFLPLCSKPVPTLRNCLTVFSSMFCSPYSMLCTRQTLPSSVLCSCQTRRETTSGLFARPPARPSRLITVIPRLTCNFERPLLTIFVDILSDYGSDLWVFNCGKGSSPLAALGFRGSGVSQWQGRAAIASQTAITPLWRSAALHCVAR